MQNESTKRPPFELLDTNQRLGVLPTWSFWQRASARPFARPFMVIGLALTVAIILWAHLSEWQAAVVGLCLPALSLGLAERSLRARLKRQLDAKNSV